MTNFFKRIAYHVGLDRQIKASVLAVSVVLGAVTLAPLPASANDKAGDTAQKIADHFASIKTMMGEFIQLGPNGDQIAGKFFISRPGKLRFNYEKPSPIRVISDGRNLAVGNQSLKTWSLYPLRTTPLKLLLANEIDLGSKTVKSVEESESLVTIVMGNKSIFGNSTITLLFDRETYDLRQWTIRDAQGKDTTIMIFDTQSGVEFAKSVFRVPYDQARKNRKSGDG